MHNILLGFKDREIWMMRIHNQCSQYYKYTHKPEYNTAHINHTITLQQPKPHPITSQQPKPHHTTFLKHHTPYTTLSPYFIEHHTRPHMQQIEVIYTHAAAVKIIQYSQVYLLIIEICIHTHTYKHTYTHTRTLIYTQWFSYTDKHTHHHPPYNTHKHTHTHIYAQRCMCVCVCVI